MAKSTHVNTSSNPKKPGREGQSSYRVTTAPIRADRNPAGQNKSGTGNKGRYS